MMGSIIVRQKRTVLVLEKNLAITVSIDWHGLHRPNFGNMTKDQRSGIPEIFVRRGNASGIRSRRAALIE
jgi:hypothetical protein